VTRTIWLASYPKSGNTWFRMLVANLSATDKPVDINDLPDRGGISSARGAFDFFTLIDSGLLTFDEIDALRPRVYEALARGEADDEYDMPPETPPVRFAKTHDAYARLATGEALMGGAAAAAGAILIVRDPRDVAPSLANHNRSSLDEAIAFMNSADAAVCGGANRQHPQLRQRLLNWSEHAVSWLDQTDIPVHLIRYEELQEDTAHVFRRALAFAGHEATDEQIERAVSFARFDELKRQEEASGFREVPRPTTPVKFFRRGIAGAWRDELTSKQVQAIEAAHANVMRRLGYPLAVETRKPGEAA